MANEALARAMAAAILAFMTGFVSYTLLLDPVPRWSGERRRRNLWDGIFFLPFFTAVACVAWLAMGPAARAVQQAPGLWCGGFVTVISLLGALTGRIYHSRMPALRKVSLVLGLVFVLTSLTSGGSRRTEDRVSAPTPGWFT